MVTQAAYTAIESLSVQQTQFSIDYAITDSQKTQFVISFEIILPGGSWNIFNEINLVGIFVTGDWIQIGVAHLNGITNVVNYKNEHLYNSAASYSLQIFANSFPLTYTITSYQSSNFTLTITTNQIVTFASSNIISYVLVQKTFQANSIFIVFNIITQSNTNYVLAVDQEGYMGSSDLSCFQGISQLKYSSPDIYLTRLSQYNYFDPPYRTPSIKVGYMSTSSVLNVLRSTYMNFNPHYAKCSQQKFLAYTIPFTTFPTSCKACHPNCLTCTSDQLDSTYTDYRFCTSCSDLRYLSPLPSNSFGQCLCLEGLTMDENGNCLPCTFDCLTFEVNLMRSSSIAIFLLTFTYANLTFSIDFQDNLLVYVQDEEVPYNSTNLSPGAFTVSLESQYLSPCQKTCQVKFYFISPSKISHENKRLTTRTVKMTVSDFYIVSPKFPAQLGKVFFVSTMVVAASSSSGQTALVKMLFELQQAIQVHKYLNMQIPVVFKQFVQALASFRFLDITVIFDYNIDAKIQQLSEDDIDCKGPPKVVYYQNGANYYKNMVPVVVSIFIIMIFNFILYVIFRHLPCQFFYKLSERMKIRWPITLADNIQSSVIPIALFFTFQINYTILKPSFIWIYILSYVCAAIILLFPFFAVGMIRTAYVKTDKDDQEDTQNKDQNKKKENKQLQRNILQENIQQLTAHQRKKLDAQIQKQIVQDFLLDTKLSKIAYTFFVFGYLKKFMFGIILASNFSGMLQLLLLILLNIAHLVIMISIVRSNAYKSSYKIICRIFSLICLIVIQFLILSYNIIYSTIQAKILIGTTCTIFTIISTGIGILQIFIKIGQVLKQKILFNKLTDHEKQTVKIAVTKFVRGKDNKVIKCQIIDSLQLQSISNSQQNLTKRKSNQYGEIQYQQNYKKFAKKLNLKNNFNKSYDRSEEQKNNEDEEWSNFQQNKYNTKNTKNTNKKFQTIKKSKAKQKNQQQQNEEWSNFQQNNDNKKKAYQIGSEDSDIAPISSSDTIYWTNQPVQIKQRPNSRLKKLHQRMALKNIGKQQRRPSASTNGGQINNYNFAQNYQKNKFNTIQQPDSYSRNKYNVKKTIDYNNNINKKKLQINQTNRVSTNNSNDSNNYYIRNKQRNKNNRNRNRNKNKNKYNFDNQSEIADIE